MIRLGICVAILVIRAIATTIRNGARTLQFSSQNPRPALPLGEVLHVQFSNLGSYKSTIITRHKLLIPIA